MNLKQNKLNYFRKKVIISNKLNINLLEVFFMFVVFSKDRIVSYLVSISTVAILFVMSFAITKRNDEILKTSANSIKENILNEIVADE